MARSRDGAMRLGPPPTCGAQDPLWRLARIPLSGLTWILLSGLIPVPLTELTRIPLVWLRGLHWLRVSPAPSPGMSTGAPSTELALVPEQPSTEWALGDVCRIVHELCEVVRAQHKEIAVLHGGRRGPAGRA